jgi:methyl-accepting chemotaxis protein
MFASKEILEELKKINKSIEYQTKILEEIFMKKDESQRTMHENKAMIKGVVDSMSDLFKARGMNTAPFQKIINAIGDGKK